LRERLQGRTPTSKKWGKGLFGKNQDVRSWPKEKNEEIGGREKTVNQKASEEGVNGKIMNAGPRPLRENKGATRDERKFEEYRKKKPVFGEETARIVSDREWRIGSQGRHSDS